MITYIIYKYMTFKEVLYVSNLQPRKYIWTEENVKKRRINKNHINLDIFIFINTLNLILISIFNCQI